MKQMVEKKVRPPPVQVPAQPGQLQAGQRAPVRAPGSSAAQSARAHARLEALRRDTVERHQGYAQRLDLAKTIREKTDASNYRMERESILGHQTQAGHLPQHLELRLDYLNRLLQK